MGKKMEGLQSHVIDLGQDRNGQMSTNSKVAFLLSLNLAIPADFL
jgi:hypothetical protein